MKMVDIVLDGTRTQIAESIKQSLGETECILAVKEWMRTYEVDGELRAWYDAVLDRVGWLVQELQRDDKDVTALADRYGLAHVPVEQTGERLVKAVLNAFHQEFVVKKLPRYQPTLLNGNMGRENEDHGLSI